MPYHIARSSGCPSSRPWGVIKSATGRVMGCHPDEGSAQKQMAALYANEPRGGNMPRQVDLATTRLRDRARRLNSLARHIASTPIAKEQVDAERLRTRHRELAERLKRLAQAEDGRADRGERIDGEARKDLDLAVDQALTAEKAGNLDRMLAVAVEIGKPAGLLARALGEQEGEVRITPVAHEHRFSNLSELARHMGSDAHHFEQRAVDDSAWDKSAAMSGCASSDTPASCYESICAGRRDGDPSVQSTWALPHHKAPGDPANANAVRDALARFNQTDGLTNAEAARRHLEAHMAQIQSGRSADADLDGLAVASNLGVGYRSLEYGFRDAAGDEPPVLFGYFNAYNQWAEIRSEFEGEFLERVAPGAFDEAIKEYWSNRGAGGRGTIRLIFQHGRDGQMGSKVIGKPEVLESRSQGPYFEAPLYKGIPQLLVEGLRDGQYGMSYRFDVPRGGDSWVTRPQRSDYNPRALPERTLTRGVRIPEFGPVTFPAYAGATVGVRSLSDYFASTPIIGDAGKAPQMSGGTTETPAPSAEQVREARDRHLRVLGVL